MEQHFAGAGSWSFDNAFARNFAIFGVDNILSSHTDYCKNIFLVLGEGPTDDDMSDSVCTAEEKVNIKFSKVMSTFALILHYNCGSSHLFINGEKISKFKDDDKNVNFHSQYI